MGVQNIIGHVSADLRFCRPGGLEVLPVLGGLRCACNVGLRGRDMVWQRCGQLPAIVQPAQRGRDRYRVARRARGNAGRKFGLLQVLNPERRQLAVVVEEWRRIRPGIDLRGKKSIEYWRRVRWAKHPHGGSAEQPGSQTADPGLPQTCKGIAEETLPKNRSRVLWASGCSGVIRRNLRLRGLIRAGAAQGRHEAWTFPLRRVKARYRCPYPIKRRAGANRNCLRLLRDGSGLSA
eukprot:scaffold250517_cov44-Prasinocladus_malaysianus.AAC.2